MSAKRMRKPKNVSLAHSEWETTRDASVASSALRAFVRCKSNGNMQKPATMSFCGIDSVFFELTDPPGFGAELDIVFEAGERRIACKGFVSRTQREGAGADVAFVQVRLMGVPIRTMIELSQTQ